MDIIIVGAGTVGCAICKQLLPEGHNVTVIDTDVSPLSELSSSSDVSCVEGNGANISTLRRAGAEKADLLIAVAEEDEVNILCCSAAKKLGTRHTIARVRNPEYSELMQIMKSEMSLSMTINPELAAAKEIYRTLRFPSAAKIDTFCKGRVEVAELGVPEHSPICSLTLNELRAKYDMKFLVCCAERGGKIYIPSGDFRIEEGDTICITAPDADVTKFFKAVGMYKNPVQSVIITGGGRITYYLEALLKQGKIRSTVIEKDKELCRELAEQYSCNVVCEDGTNQDALLEEGIRTADAFIALSDIDEENAIVSLYAKTVCEGKIITKINAMSYLDFYLLTGLDCIISPQSITAVQITRYVRAMANTRTSEIESLHRLMDGKVEALEIIIKDDIDGITEIPLKKLRPRAGVLIACIARKNDIIIPMGDDMLKKGDTVILITSDLRISDIKDIVSR